ncbi:MAG: Holliday junction branch migration protein RuvA [Chlamydiales bacterium]|nr:Holliday junction branch migration protein RuvA [Chlamydiales bacterium]
MYAYIKGTLAEATPLEAVVEAHGIGYRIFVSVKDFARLPQIGDRLFLYTSFVVRELSQTLYGFFAKEERDLFEKVITVSGIGPKTGMALIGHLTLPELEKAIQSHDSVSLAKVPGIGKKTAERLIIELQGRSKVQPLPEQFGGRIADALQALIQLGYTQATAEKAVRKAADSLSSDCDLSDLITAALKYR